MLDGQMLCSVYYYLANEHKVQRSTRQKFPSEEPEEGNDEKEIIKPNNSDWIIEFDNYILKIGNFRIIYSDS